MKCLQGKISTESKIRFIGTSLDKKKYKLSNLKFKPAHIEGIWKKLMIYQSTSMIYQSISTYVSRPVMPISRPTLASVDQRS